MALLNRRRLAAAVVLGALLRPDGVGRAQEVTGESAIKAAFLYNFTKFIGWPERAFSGSSAPFTVCVFADEAAKRAVVETMRKESVRGRPVSVEFPAESDDLKGCHLVYFGHREDDDRTARRLQLLRQAPVLTVGEGRGFLDRGGLIAFALVDDRVRFDISRRAAEAAGLNVSSKLLRVARHIEGGTP
jgi:hypothetical protein